MPDLPPRQDLGTHRVANQPSILADPDLFLSDPYLQTHAKARGVDASHLEASGKIYSQPAMRQAALEARRDPPRLVSHDQHGRQLDEVHYNASYHGILRAGLKAGYANVAWTAKFGGHANHAAHVYLLSQVEPGCCCPLTMTYAAMPVFRSAPEIGEIWLPKMLSTDYDPSLQSIDQKRGVMLGMAMTEKQGGSDVRTNATMATADGDAYRLRGHKWFCSAPMSDAFLTLAQTQKGLTCFLVPRWLPDGRNAIRILRMKNKLGNQANASAEIEYEDALAYRIGEDGEGVRTIIKMVHHTRLDTALAPAGLMRAALHEALHWVRYRHAFGAALVEQPLMQSVLADLALDVEAAVALGFMVAQSFDGDSDEDRAFARVAVALAKFINNKRAPTVISECMEVLGGMGYVEDTALPMLYREAPLNGIWEGAGNVICLDILRTLSLEKHAKDALMTRLKASSGKNAHFDTALAVHHTRWPNSADEGEARWFCESLALLLSAAALLETAPATIADGFIASRLSEHRGAVAGAVNLFQTDAILARALGKT